MKSTQILIRSLLLFMLMHTSFSFAQDKEQRLLMRLTDFRYFTFEHKKQEKKGFYSTQNTFLTFDRLTNPMRFYAEGAFRLGYEKHVPLTKRFSYFMGADLGVGFRLMDFSDDYDFHLYGGVGYELGLNFDISKNFAFGIQSQLWLRYMLPLHQRDENAPFEVQFGFDPDWLSFNFIFKFQDKPKK